MARGSKKSNEKKVTRYTYENVKEPRMPETGHTPLLPADEQVVTLPMDNGWSKAIQVEKLPEGDERPVVVDMDPAADPVLFWAGKRNRRQIPVLPLQRNEIVSESRISQIIERARKAAAKKEPAPAQGHLFADLEKTLRESEKSKRVEFYTHEEGWKNKLICGDSLQVMESLIHYEGLRGKVQMIYIDPPYGIKYDSNFQQRVDTTKNDENDKADDILTIKAFRDTWALGIHSYLSYLQERLYLCRELLADSGSVLVQISEYNVHLVRALLDEVFGNANFAGQIVFRKTSGKGAATLDTVFDLILWYAKEIEQLKFNQLYIPRQEHTMEEQYNWIELSDGSCRRLSREELEDESIIPSGRRFKADGLYSESGGEGTSFVYRFKGKDYNLPPHYFWKTNREGMGVLENLSRLIGVGNTLCYKRYAKDFPYTRLNNLWNDTMASGYGAGRFYVVQTSPKVVERCISMTTAPGDLVFDPTCGGGTTAYSAEKLGRRWVTCDTSRVAINVARRRLLSVILPHFKTKTGRVNDGFVCATAQRVTLGSLTQGQEPGTINFLDQPEVDKDAVRVCGPFEVMTLGRYSVEDWKGYMVREGGIEGAKVENYIGVICRLYRRDAAIQGASGLIHAVAESEHEKIGISVGPLTGRVTAKQINDAVQDGLASGLLEIHVLGWAFEANVGEIKSQLESRGKVNIYLIMIRPDTLAEGLKATQPEQLFSPLALPDIEVAVANGKGKAKIAEVTLKGVGVFDRKKRTTDYYRADSGYVAAWYLDEDYDGDCFVDCQMFFDFGKTPNLKAALKVEVEPEEYKLQLTSQPFPVQGYKRIAVKVVDVYGNESTIVKSLD